MAIFTSTADLSQTAWESEQYEAWERQHADALYREQYVEWCASEGVEPVAGDPDDDAEWMAYLESTLPDDPE